MSNIETKTRKYFDRDFEKTSEKDKEEKRI